MVDQKPSEREDDEEGLYAVAFVLVSAVVLSSEVLEDVFFAGFGVCFETVGLWLYLFVVDKSSCTYDPGTQSNKEPKPLEKKNFIKQDDEHHKCSKYTSNSSIRFD